MATIVFMPFHWASDLNPTFALARKLRNRGHRVHYLCIPDTEPRIRSQGFDFSPIFSRAFPEGTLEKQSESEAQGKSYGLTEFRDRFRGTCELLREGELDRATHHIQPDLLLTSSGTPWVGIAACQTGIPVISFSSTLISVEDSAVPPFNTNSIPKHTLRSRLRTWFEWRKLFLYRRLSRRWDISEDLKSLARHFGYPVSKIDFRVETWPRLLLPELVFFPKELDFPRPRKPEGAFFIEASVDVERRDGDFSWDRIDANKPLVYCTLGSVLPFKFPARAAQFFQMFMDAMAQRPALQGVVTIGNYLKADEFNCPENVLIASWAPQVEVLKRASLMISHGGVTGVKESAFVGVPMLLIPVSYDEFGNAARIVYHGLGARLRLNELSAFELGRLIDRVLGDPSYSARSERMSETLLNLEQQSPAVAIIENIL
ncbi:MAG TPA: glycosyltransferase [Pyrinomonadaceae bacterium]|nr:glycosyltransferase [Pyrinomonadaceae bacterium]